MQPIFEHLNNLSRNIFTVMGSYVNIGQFPRSSSRAECAQIAQIHIDKRQTPTSATKIQASI